MAREMVEVIREQLKAGRTPDEIRAFFLSKYGDWILLSPRPRGLNLVVWIGPFAAAAAGLLLALVTVRRWARRSSRPEHRAVDPALAARVREELRRYRDPSGQEVEALSPRELEWHRLYVALRELEFDHRSGKLSEADYHAMREDYEERAAAVVADLGQQPLGAAEAPVKPRRGGKAVHVEPGRWRPWRLLAGAVFLLTFGVAVGLFLTMSLRPRMGAQDSPTGDFLTGTGPGGIMPGSRTMPGHLETLMASGRSAFAKQDWRAAIDAFKQALDMDPRNPEALSSMGLILLQAGHGDEALQTVERALASSPGYPLALWAKGLALFESKQDYPGAIQTWEALLARGPAPADADRVAGMIAEARKRLEAKPAATSPATGAVRRLTGTVSVAQALRAEVTSTSALFVIARKGEGPPLAVKRIPRPSFPVTFSLGPEDRMSAGVPFEGEVRLSVRLKRDGTAGPPVPGDLSGDVKAPVKIGQDGVPIVLDRAH
jgi:cytochrome c-type biogenesis protein CcmH